MSATDDLARRMVTRQVEMAQAELARDAERLATAARQYADDIERGLTGGGARRLAQDAADLALQERHLAGLRTIADLITGTPA